MYIREQLIEFAQQLGFDVCKVARANSPQHAREFYEWLANGHAGEMQWLERNAARRTDPQLVLPGAKCVVVLGMNYFQGTRAIIPSETGESRGDRVTLTSRDSSAPLRSGRNDTNRARIARYAWGEDYHPLIEKKLARIDNFLRAHGGVQKYYVDTGPVLERDYAAAAGIGWQGKSTMLLNRELGTWFFLATILTTLELPADSPQPNRCGTCTRCIDACPTGALAEYQLDARRCISYLTIELKGSIPLELRPLIGDRIYGCDACLEVCPWNRFAHASRETAFHMKPEIAAMRLRDYLHLDEAKFRALFRDSPIKRTKRRGLLRNVCVALGNVGTEEDLPALRCAARDPAPLIAEHAIWAIEQIEKRLLPFAGERSDVERCRREPFCGTLPDSSASLTLAGKT
ncbi:MAG: tRNA epoxyqueuosine(34) reductase QueG [Verrucomicrobia bacterium]|nr:tRNA epoxyqueuosine(34) reductase QueG [Verrucomicrobiota bacterium]